MEKKSGLPGFKEGLCGGNEHPGLARINAAVCGFRREVSRTCMSGEKKAQ